MIITMASGKGGTGKTTVSVNLAALAAGRGHRVHLCDCDVEEPNAHLFLNPKMESSQPVELPLPVVNQELCSHCGKCSEICEFNAIASLPNQTIVFPELCHSCSGCWLVCPQKAIEQGVREIGWVEGSLPRGMTFTRGRIKVGETQVPPVVEAVKAVPAPETLVIRDAPPGVTCPTVAALEGSDFVVLVAEPTAFGLNDLRAAVELVRQMELPFAVMINRLGSGDSRVEDYCQEEGITLLPGLPFRKSVAVAISKGELITQTLPEMTPYFNDLFQSICQLAGQETP